ncbi:MerR family transcriptional regulator [Microbacterium sp.]|uniref:MerR family transcriptional regulator n=1 Tax=Microbacterium sp. TaxID=51671 RepID=UPI0028112CC5|nr:MerR family transcriptional regulator [Microbacterium sp.]
MKISEAASTSGASPRSLRYYEDQGLIVPGRTTGGFRDYCGSTIDRVLVIRSLLESGLPVRLIRRVLQAPPEPEGGVDPALVDDVRRYRTRLSARIAALSAQEAALAEYLAALGSDRSDDA